MDEQCTSDFGLHPRALGWEVAAAVSDAAYLGKRHGVHQDQHAFGMRLGTGRPSLPAVSVVQADVSDVCLLIGFSDAQHPSQKMFFHPIRIRWQWARFFSCDSPSLVSEVNDNFFRHRRCRSGILERSNIAMGGVFERGFQFAQVHLNIRNFLVESQNCQLRLWHHKGQNALRALQLRMRLGQTLEDARRWCPSAKYNVSQSCQAPQIPALFPVCVDVRQISWRMPSAVMKSV